MNRETSAMLFARAKKLMPGGVSSPVRAFKSVGGDPVFIKKANGSYIWDEDDNRYIDYVGSWGPAILGHCHSEVLGAVVEVAQNGFSFGAPTRNESKLAEKIIEALPAMEMIRFVSSGTEACMSAIRLARGYTKRDYIVKFTGNYHGHGDMLLAKAGSGVATFGLPDSPGVPKGAVEHTLCCPYNDIKAIEELFRKYPEQIAAVILEPIVGNAGFIRPGAEFLPNLRELTTQSGALLIMDEVMTGFRAAWGGVQVNLNIKPDLTTLGKVIGGGMPLAAYGGRSDIMQLIAPSGPVYQAGTLSGNPLATACGLKTLELLQKSGNYQSLANLCKKLMNGFNGLAEKYRIPFISDWEGGMFGFFFCDSPIKRYEDTNNMNIEIFRRFHRGMLDKGFYFAPSAYEAGFVSLAHSMQDIQATIDAADEVFQELADSL
ncbi:MAG: glutamate-1-semialdehyde 2,1-aminomutase [Bdellovibrionota bacterium]